MSKKNVLVPLTKSEYSHQILPFVEKFISPEETELILFYVTKPPKGFGLAEADFRPDYVLPTGATPVVPQEPPIYASQQEDSIEAHVIKDLLPTTNRLKEAGYSVTVLVDFGEDTVAEIARAVEKKQIDLVAMSTVAREGILRFFFSDLADAVMKRVNIPVLLFHPTL
jgi:nucleotide-binding universal stress UspA family protein